MDLNFKTGNRIHNNICFSKASFGKAGTLVDYPSSRNPVSGSGFFKGGLFIFNFINNKKLSMIRTKGKSGIYQIRNFTNEKRYIGSSQDIKRRFDFHFRNLKENKHPNKYLQNAWDKYGENNFIFEFLLYCHKKNLIKSEQQTINSYFFENLYNILPIAGNILGFKHSEETKQKISEARKENKGTKLSEAHKQKLSEAKKGKKKKPFSEQAKYNMAKAAKKAWKNRKTNKKGDF